MGGKGAHDDMGTIGRSTFGVLIGQRARVEQQPVLLDAPNHRRVAGAQAGGQLVGREAGRGSATAGPGSSSSGSAPPPTFAAAVHHLAPLEVRRDRPRPLPAARGRRRASPARGSRAARAQARGTAAASPRAPRGPACRAAARAPAGGARRRRPPRRARPSARPAARRAACRREKQTSAAPAAHGAAHRRLLAQHLRARPGSRADVVDHRHAERAQLLDRDLLDEPELAEVRGVRAQHRAGALADRALVVGAPRAVGRADLDEPRARPARSPRARGSRRRSRRAARARRRPRAPARPAPRPRAALRRRSC